MRALRIVAPLGALALGISAVSCGPAGPNQSPAALPMQQHWDAGQALQTAMARGDLTAARRAAARIAEVQEIPGLEWDAGPYLHRVREAAQAVQSARSFGDAAQATGRMGVACGSCHARSDGGPHPEGTTTAPDTEEDTQRHMIRHTWAVDRMWEGLVVPSSDRWRAGARVLAEQPVSSMGLSPDVGLLAARIHEMGRQAMNDTSPEARADRFSRILTDCAGCHAELGIQ